MEFTTHAETSKHGVSPPRLIFVHILTRATWTKCRTFWSVHQPKEAILRLGFLFEAINLRRFLYSPLRPLGTVQFGEV